MADYSMLYNVTHKAEECDLENSTVSNVPEMSAVDAMFTIIYWLLALVICFSNSITILIVCQTRSLRTIPNMYIVTLAVADFLIGVNLPYFTVTNFPSMMLYFSTRPYMCLARYILLYTFLSNSFLCIFCIALDRYVFIVHPLRYKQIVSVRRTSCIIFLTWALSCCFSLSAIWNFSWNGKCDVYSVISRGYQLYGLTPFLGIVFILTALLYISITKTAMRQRNAVSNVIVLQPAREEFLRRSTLRSMKLFLVVYGMFVLCWIPAYVQTIIGNTVGSTTLAFHICFTLGISNSGINFVIYACMSKEFRKAVNAFALRKCNLV